jgi:hypothetical protein
MNYQWRDLVGSLVDGKYPLVEYLGDVAGNGVFATNPVNSRQAIIRLMPGGSEQANLMLEQWRAATALKHPHIAGTYAAGETEVIGNTVVFTVTERPDDSLAEAVRNRALSESEARGLTESTLGALAYLHQSGFAHGAVSPDNIVAMGEKIKLAPWTIYRATPKEMAKDVFAMGQTISEVLTQKRPTGEASLPRNLPEPFNEVARACLRMTVGAGEALRMMSSAPESVPAATKKLKLPTAAIVAASLAVVALVYGMRTYTSSADTRSEDPPPQSTAANLPSPVQETVRQRSTPEAPPAAAKPPASTRGDWVVVAEIYKQHDQATKRAEQIGDRWKDLQPEVYPPNPNGRRFMVVLGFSETRKGAEQLLARARSEGVSRNVYLTRLKR